MRDNERAGQVVRFWRTIEMFSPQSVPKSTSGFTGDAGQGVLDVGPDELAPWQAGHPVTDTRLPDNMTWQFTIYGGLYDVSRARTELVNVFGADTKPDDARRDARTALFAFSLDAEGCLLESSAVLSACAWGISRLRSPGPSSPSWLDGFEGDEQSFVMGLNRLVPPKLGSETGEVGKGLATAGAAIRRQVKNAAVEAVVAGAKATGAAVGTATAAVASSVTGPVIGGIAGAVAGKFAEKLLTPPVDDRPDSAEVRVPRLSMSSRTLHDFVRELAAALDVVGTLAPQGVRVQCTRVPVRDSDEAVEQTFLNSFIANDLARVERAVRDRDIGHALSSYLADSRSIPTSERVDVRRDREAIVAGVAPRHLPGGRWPAAVTKPLVISQQFAVNQIMRELADGTGVFAVNGPPGTGKTTMLRDVLAAIVVERARKLATLSDPSEAFTEVLERVPLGKTYQATVRGIRAELTGFEIVVATASNDAAANVTAEIPAVGAVRGAEEEALAADYFTDLASDVLGAPAWGMVAAVLGNMKNRSAFVRRFWYGDGTDNRHQNGNVGMLEILRQVRADADSAPDWVGAVTSFRNADAEVRRLTAARQDVAEAITELARIEHEVSGAERRIEDADAICAGLREAVRRSIESLNKAKTEFDDADAEYQNHLDHKPGFWISLSTFFRAGREWRTEHRDLATERRVARGRFNAIGPEVERLKADLAGQHMVRNQCQIDLDDVRRRAAAVRARVDAGRARWPGTVPFGDDLAADEPFQMCAPWADQELTLARNRLFLAALGLHKAFILNAEANIRGNLAVIVASIRRRLPMRQETLLAAWRSLFLVVPMISTTFASLPRLFVGLGPESFGWLFIDEAGQATPQEAVGGLWRSRRAVIVGDPRQLEPIVTLPSSAQHAMRRYYGVHEQWSPDAVSVQRVADRLARHGTTLVEPDGERVACQADASSNETVWVGSPLRVHRRCDRPIFEISNTIAYGGDLMVYGTNVSGGFPGENTWLDVQSGRSRGNWVPAEGNALVELLNELLEQGIGKQDIRVISPFRDVVFGGKDIVRSVFGYEFADKHVGTVHTVQGQESEVVILVLGSAPRNVRARDWAAEKPNLLNVAVSRAKRRLYIIGNRDNWKDLPYYNVAAAALTVRRYGS